MVVSAEEHSQQVALLVEVGFPGQRYASVLARSHFDSHRLEMGYNLFSTLFQLLIMV